MAQCIHYHLCWNRWNDMQGTEPTLLPNRREYWSYWELSLLRKSQIKRRSRPWSRFDTMGLKSKSLIGIAKTSFKGKRNVMNIWAYHSHWNLTSNSQSCRSRPHRAAGASQEDDSNQYTKTQLGHTLCVKATTTQTPTENWRFLAKSGNGARLSLLQSCHLNPDEDL